MKRKYIIFAIFVAVVAIGSFFIDASRLMGLMRMDLSNFRVTVPGPDLFFRGIWIESYSNNYVKIDVSYKNQGVSTDKSFKISMQFPMYKSALNDVILSDSPVYPDNVFYSLEDGLIPNKQTFLVDGGIEKGVSVTKTFFVPKYYVVNSDDKIVFTIDEDDETGDLLKNSNTQEIAMQKDLWELKISKDLGCQTITKPGTYTIRPCDQILYNGNKVIINSVTNNLNGNSQNAVLYDREITKPDFTKKFYSGTLVMEDLSYFDYNSTMSGYGFNLALKSIDVGGLTCDISDVLSGLCPKNKPTAEVEIYSSCLKNYNNCMKNSQFEKACSAYCEQSDGIKNIVYFETPNTVVDVPVGYEDAGLLASKNAENCFNMISQETGMYPKEKVKLSYLDINASDDSSESDSACYLSAGIGWKVWCDIFPKFKNEKLKNINDYNELENQVNSGVCVSGYTGIIGGMAHEITHNMAYNTIYNTFSGEGLATYIGSIFATWVPAKSAPILVCDNDSWYWDPNNADATPYDKFTPKEYNSGACFFQKMKEKYGGDIIKKIFQNAEIVNVTKKQFCYRFFKDFVEPVVGDVLPWVMQMFPHTEDPMRCYPVVNE